MIIGEMNNVLVGLCIFLMTMFSNVACSNFDVSNIFDMIAKNSSKSLKFVEIHSETLFTKEIKVTGRYY